ncbi:MAG TPA: phage tail protein [Syntrophorhabdales bacterium]|nr:phage tail protein [Syntrophorhabdales bacterium]
MPTSTRTDPYKACNFRVEIDGLTTGSFSECSGLTAEIEVIDYREGADKALNVRKLPGLRKYSNITLKRGYTNNTELWDWYRNIVQGKADRRNGAIILLDDEHNDVMRWSIKNALIKKIEGPSLKADGNEVAIESVELAHEGLTLES